MTMNRKQLSSVDPDFYAFRFVSFIKDITDFSLYRPKSPEQSPKAITTGRSIDISNGKKSEKADEVPSSLSPLSVAAALITKLSPRNNGIDKSLERSPQENSSRGTPTRSSSEGKKKVYFSDDESGQTSRSMSASRQPLSPRSVSPLAEGGDVPPTRLENKRPSSQLSRSSSQINRGNKLEDFLSQSMINSPSRQRTAAPTSVPRDFRVDYSTNPRGSSTASHFEDQQSPGAISPDRFSKHPSVVAIRGTGANYRGRGSGRMTNLLISRSPPQNESNPARPSSYFLSNRTASEPTSGRKSIVINDVSTFHPRIGSGTPRKPSSRGNEPG